MTMLATLDLARSWVDLRRELTLGTLLTPTQHEILIRLAHGDSAEQIALQRKQKLRAIQDHVARIKMQLGAKNTAHAVAIGIVMGIVQIEIGE